MLPSASAMDFFQLFIPDNALKDMVVQTNMYAMKFQVKCFCSAGPSHSSPQAWQSLGGPGPGSPAGPGLESAPAQASGAAGVELSQSRTHSA